MNPIRKWIQVTGCIAVLTVTLMRNADAQALEVARNVNLRHTGMWIDPYSGDTMRDPRQLDVDYVVPLANAHLAGGWRWAAARKREYANFLADTLHLLAVRNSLNRQKGAKSPDEWRPPNTAFSCTYVIAWESIKQRWGLDMTVNERAAIDSVRTARNCSN